MQMDECTPYPADKKTADKSLEPSLIWGEKSKEAIKQSSNLFGIIQGGVHDDLRDKSLCGLLDIDFDGCNGAYLLENPQKKEIKF